MPVCGVVIKPGGDPDLLSGILARYAHWPDARQVDILFGGATDRADYLRDGRADVALVDAPPSHLVVAWSRLDRRPLAASFVQAAVAAGRVRPAAAPAAFG